MKKKQAISIYRILAKISLNKFNKETRNALIETYEAALEVTEAFDKKVENLRKKLFEGCDIEGLAELRRKKNACKDPETRRHYDSLETTNYASVLELEKDLQTQVDKFLDETVTIKLTKIARADFIDGCVEADITVDCDMLNVLKPIFK